MSHINCKNCNSMKKLNRSDIFKIIEVMYRKRGFHLSISYVVEYIESLPLDLRYGWTDTVFIDMFSDYLCKRHAGGRIFPNVYTSIDDRKRTFTELSIIQPNAYVSWDKDVYDESLVDFDILVK